MRGSSIDFRKVTQTDSAHSQICLVQGLKFIPVYAGQSSTYRDQYVTYPPLSDIQGARKYNFSE
jgi:hypothetical protein